LREFYRRVRPSGWWPADWLAPDRAEHRADWRVLGAAVVWQLVTFLLPMGLMLRMWGSVAPAAVLWLALGWYLWPRAGALSAGAPTSPGTTRGA
jgi:hypothetical protein